MNRYAWRGLDGARTWIEPVVGIAAHSFSELHILGGAHLAFRPPDGSTTSQVVMDVDTLQGDKSGT